MVALALLSGTVVIIEKVLPPHPEAHNNPLLLLAVFLATLGVQFIMLGLLAELLVRVYHESQGKRTYVLRDALERGPHSYWDRSGDQASQPGISPGPTTSLSNVRHLRAGHAFRHTSKREGAHSNVRAPGTSRS
jgi:hypothetical protein